MKKTILIVALAVLALGVLGVGAVFAQDVVPPVGVRGPMMQNGTSGPMHTFMVVEFAKKLGLNVNDINARLSAGEVMYDIALSAGVTAEEFPALITEVRANALDAAVKANVITQEQADWMESRGAGMTLAPHASAGMTLAPHASAGMTGAGYNGNCPMQDGDYQQNGNGFRGGPGGMMGGWGAQQTNP